MLVTHIVCGGTSLILGMYILFCTKADRRHKFVGTIYFYTMFVTALLAILMACFHPSYFLLSIGVFTTYMLLTGKRYLKKKTQFDVKRIDWILSFAMLLFGATFIGLACYNLVKANYFGIVHLVFGGISWLFVYQDYKNYSGTSTVKNYWLVTHLQRMVVSYIASVTAFIVVNNSLLPGIIAWLLPAFLLVPLIIKWSRRHEIRQDLETQF